MKANLRNIFHFSLFTFHYALLLLCVVILASCSNDDDTDTKPKTMHKVQLLATNDQQGEREYMTAVRGTGYTYRTNTNYCMGTGIEVFNLARINQLQERMNGILGGPELICTDYNTGNNQRVTIAESLTELDSKLSVSLGV